MARSLGCKLYRVCVKDNVNVDAGAWAQGETQGRGGSTLTHAARQRLRGQPS